MIQKPVLFHDIDGVLYGHYGPQNAFQLRPGVADWLTWAHDHFTVIWLTAWGEPKVRELLKLIWPKDAQHCYMGKPPQLRVAD